MARLRGSTLVEESATDGWELASSSSERPEDLDGASWLPVTGPMTVAAALRAHGLWDLGRDRAFDAETWWYRCTLPAIAEEQGHEVALRLGGLATIADVFIDGAHVLRSDNMFLAHRIDLGASLRASRARPRHDLSIRFSPVAAALAVKRPRPRYKTRLVAHQQLRWIRTSLVGRMPGWSPPVPPIGPWRPVTIERWSRAVVEDVDLRTRVDGDAGLVTIALRLRQLSAEPLESAALVVGDERALLRVARDGERIVLEGELSIRSARLWWPHTHGPQPSYPARVTLALAGEEEAIDLGAVAFRTIEVDARGGGFSVSVNGAPVFCRGACWTTTDVVTLTGAPESYARVLGAVREAGMNMLRLSGTLFYESDTFYDACDELGILLWQDFMFANMDYPVADEAFRASVTREAEQILARLRGRPSLAVLCGGSEVEQQAAMFGAAREIWRGPLAGELLPAACAATCPDVTYVPSSPSGGALPFHVDEGVAHYYGVGAYLRPFDDARRSRVRFAAECLAFANVPEDDLFAEFLADGDAPVVSARWKQRTSKDNGSAWDFEDVRDHYLALLFGVDPTRVRTTEVDRYLALARVTSGEVMARVFAEFRRPGSTCKGALVWFLQDLWPGAGWGVLDARGEPKAPWWFLKRALRPVALFVTDEGLNGLHLHAVNDTSQPIAARLCFTLYRDGEVRTARGEREIVVPARGGLTVAGDALLDAFADTARAYRFGPPGHDVAVASLVAPGGGAIAEAVHLSDFASAPACDGLEAFLSREDGALSVKLKARRFAHAVKIVVPDHLPDDQYFDLAPGSARTIALVPAGPSTRAPSGEVSALNLRAPIRLVLREPNV